VRVRSERGSVLAQVLVTMIFMSIISVAVLRARLQPALTAANSVARVKDDLSARSALNRLTESWGALGSCATDAAAGVACSGSGCACSCTVNSVVITSVPQGNACALSVAAP